jgi:hypothetical protein
MPKHSSKPKDENQIAASIMEQITQSASDNPTKNPAAVALGRLGGLKGGKARAQSLSPKRRKAIAKKAAQSRWKNKQA